MGISFWTGTWIEITFPVSFSTAEKLEACEVIFLGHTVNLYFPVTPVVLLSQTDVGKDDIY